MNTEIRNSQNDQENIPKNIYRGIDVMTGETHYFVGSYDEEAELYFLPEARRHKNVIGEYNDDRVFFTLEDAIAYKGYTSYSVAAQAALSYYKVSRLVPKGWNKKLGQKYAPWYPKRSRKMHKQ